MASMEEKYFESTVVGLEANTVEFVAVNLSGFKLHGGTFGSNS